MAVQVDTTKLKVFEEISRFPSLSKMLALSPQDFEHFVGYIFTSAGYTVEHVGSQYFPEGPGVDFNLYADDAKSTLVARVEVRRYTPPISSTPIRSWPSSASSR